MDVGLELVQAETDGERQKQAEADRNRQLQSDWHPCGQLCDVLSVPLANQVYRSAGVPDGAKMQQIRINTHFLHNCVKVRPQSGRGGRKGRQGAPKGAKKVPKTRPGAPRGRLFDILGSKCAPSQNIGIYYVSTTFPRPGGSCSAPRVPKVAAMEH